VRRIATQAGLAFPPPLVWQVLADFNSYSEWNPLNVAASGVAVRGARIAMTFANPARPGRFVRQTVTVTACDPPRLLAWRGYVPLLFEGVHSFVLEPDGSGTRLFHGEVQKGLVPQLLFSDGVLGERFVPAYEAANRALAARLEQLFGASTSPNGAADGW
jgi:hypothetical protein